MTLQDACNHYLVKGQQGQLVIKFSNDVHLCKILIADGIAVHISHGRLDPELILQTLPGKTLEWINFIAGYPVRKQLDLPLQERLLQAAKKQQSPAPDPFVRQPTQQTPQASGVKASGPLVAAEKVTAAVAGFIEQIGPLGLFLAENLAKTLNHTSGEPMAESSYSSFIAALGKEVPEAARQEFLRQFGPPSA